MLAIEKNYSRGISIAGGLTAVERFSVPSYTLVLAKKRVKPLPD